MTAVVIVDHSSEPPSYPSIPSMSLGSNAKARPPVAAAAAIHITPLNRPIQQTPQEGLEWPQYAQLGQLDSILCMQFPHGFNAIGSPHSSCWNSVPDLSFAITAPATAPSGPPASPPTVIPIIVRKNISIGKLKN